MAAAKVTASGIAARYAVVDGGRGSSKPARFRAPVTMCACLATATSTYSISTARTPPCPPRTSAAPWHDLVREEGRFLGLSEVGEQPIRRAHAVHPNAVLQIGYRESSIWA
ncbi:hypothetical protein WMF14_40470 [Sorangium sp. So ce693]